MSLCLYHSSFIRKYQQINSTSPAAIDSLFRTRQKPILSIDLYTLDHSHYWKIKKATPLEIAFYTYTLSIVDHLSKEWFIVFFILIKI